MPPRPRPDQKGGASERERDVSVPLPFRIPTCISLNVESHEKWLRMLRNAEILIQDDQDLQYKVSKGLLMKGRALPPEVLGRLYSQYCTLINRLYEAYLENVQLQRANYIQELITVVMKRMFELRNELVHLIVNDYIYVDAALLQLRMTPYDIQIVVPYHYPLESRPDSMEQLLQQMWADAIKRKNRKTKIKKVKSLTKAQLTKSGLFDQEYVANMAEEEQVEEEEESEEEDEQPSAHSMVSHDYINAVLIQRHERFRQFAFRQFLQKCNEYRKYFAANVPDSPPDLRLKAACMIQRFYRYYMEIKRKRVADHQRDVLLGIVPDVDRRPLKFADETNKLYERRRLTRHKIDKRFKEQIEKEQIKLLRVKKGDQIEDITEEIAEWFMEWYYGYGFFPQYPYELEGGTILVATGQYETIEERQYEDERIKQATKGKTKDQLKEEKEQAKQDAILKAELDAERVRKEKLALFKARCNPPSDPGYMVMQSGTLGEVADAFRKYRQSWSLYDEYPADQYKEIIYGYIKEVIREDLMNDIHLECRKYVDELMRLELKLFVKAQQAMFKRVEWKYPKLRPRKRPKPPKEIKPFIVDDEMTKYVQDIFDLGIISRPSRKLNDIMGDHKYAAYELNIDDPNARFPPAGYGDVRRRLALSCVFGSGIEPGAPRNKTVMLLGIPMNGKSFMVDCIAGELGAVKFDISPEVFSAVVRKPAKALQQVFTAARMFQPSVIFLKNVEKLFYKKVPPKEKHEKAKNLKKPLMKLLKTIPPGEKMIFIATCSNPFLSKVRPMMKLFSEVILVPKPDYGTIQRFFYDSFQKIKSMPRDLCVQGLAKCLQGLGFGLLMKVFNEVMSPERITKLCERPLRQSEFIEYLIENEIEQITEAEHDKLIELQLQYSPLKAERAEYEIINETRAYVYEKLEKKKAEDAAKREAAKGK